MTSLILRTATSFMIPLLLLFSFFLLERGHNAAGGGFAGGLVAASSFILYSLAFGVGEARRFLIVHPRTLIALGLLIALGSGLLGMVLGYPYLTSWPLWGTLGVPGLVEVEVGPPYLFELGIYLVVIGSTLSIILPLEEE